MDKHYSVAIDGPSGAGKSTLARAAAERFAFLYVDTGAIYRTVGLAVQRAGVDCGDVEAVMELLPALEIDLRYGEDGMQRMYLQGEDVSRDIRLPEISQYASKVSAIPEVRAFLLEMQRSLARKNHVIMDGRDIGTVVLPDAGLKIFLTASIRARAARRCAQLAAGGVRQELEKVMEEIAARDERDSSRDAAPLRPAEDAVVLDTTEMTLEQSVNALCELIRERFSL